MLDRLAAELRPWLIRGDVGFGNEPVMREAEQRRQPYLFKLRLTKGVKRAIERAMGEQDWQHAPRLPGFRRSEYFVSPARASPPALRDPVGAHRPFSYPT
jgi:hypothetical protein